MHKKKCSFQEINSCRLCNSKSLKEFVKFGNIPLGNNLLENRNSALNAERYPLTVNQCAKCSHFQLNANVDPKIAEFCLKAADFAGCVKTMTTKSTDIPNMRLIQGKTGLTETNSPYDTLSL